jgi:hypothetical protein
MKRKEHYQRLPDDLGPDSGKSRRRQIGNDKSDTLTCARENEKHACREEKEREHNYEMKFKMKTGMKNESKIL